MGKIGKKFVSVRFNDIQHNWEACMEGGSPKMRKYVSWSFALPSVLKFNMDGAARGKLSPVYCGVVRHSKGEDLLFLKHVGSDFRGYNEMEVLAILEALRLYSRAFRYKLIVESDSSNAV